MKVTDKDNYIAKNTGTEKKEKPTKNLPMTLERNLKVRESQEERIFINISNVLPIVRQGIIEVGYKHDRNMSFVASEAVEIGIELLWTLRGIDTIRKNRSAVNHATKDQNFRGWFDFASFNINGSAQLYFRIGKSIHYKCGGLATALGLHQNIIIHLALMTGLIHAGSAPYDDRVEMILELRKFRSWVQHKVLLSKIVKATAENMKNNSWGVDGTTNWHDVIKD